MAVCCLTVDFPAGGTLGVNVGRTLVVIRLQSPGPSDGNTSYKDLLGCGLPAPEQFLGSILTESMSYSSAFRSMERDERKPAGWQGLSEGFRCFVLFETGCPETQRSFCLCLSSADI